MDQASAGTRSSMDGQVPDTMTYEDWLSQKDKSDPAGVKEMLGPGRYDLWKSGKYDLQDFINSRGDTIPLEDL